MTTRRLQTVEIAGPSGRLAGLLHRPPGEPRFAAVASHPHPLHGGTMNNKVIYRVARALEDAGGLVLRFDFRGAGGSEGEHDGGRGERDDLSAALAFLRQSGGQGLPTLLAGFSFGSVMSALVAVRDPSIDCLLLVGAPSRLYELEGVAELGRPIAFVHGDRDEHGPIDDLRAFHDRITGPKQLVVLRGAGHFFDDEQELLRESVFRLATDGVLGAALRRSNAEAGGGTRAPARP